MDGRVSVHRATGRSIALRGKTTTPRRCGPGRTANGAASATRTSVSPRLGSRRAAFAAAVGLALSATVVALPAVAAADSRTQTYDIWNLTSTALNITGYENARDYNKVPADKLPQAKVIPLGKNFQITIAIGQGVITNFAGSQPAQQGGTQTWQVSTLLEDMDSIPVPLVHLICIPGDTRITACGVTSGNNVRALADAPARPSMSPPPIRTSRLS